MLVMDGHGSHEATEFIRINKVQVIFLPPHSSHVLQPLDLSVFGPMKQRYRSTIEELACFDDAAPVKKSRLIQVYDQARREVYVLVLSPRP
jgi:hypothetical protein